LIDLTTMTFQTSCIRILAFALVSTLVSISSGKLRADEVEKANEEVSYYLDVRPIFQRHCQGCHQPARAGGKFDITAYSAVIKGAGDEAVIIPGKPDESHLIEEITAAEGESPSMPKDAEPLSAHDVEIIRRWIAEGARDDTPESARVRYSMENPPVYETNPVLTSLDFSPDGTLLAVSGYHEVLLHRADGSGLATRLVGQSERIESAVFSPDGKRVAVTGGTPALMGEVQIWNIEKLEQPKLERSISVAYDTLYGASWSPDGRLIAFGCPDNSVRIIDASNGEQILFQGAHSDWVLDTAFSKDGSHLISVSRDRSMKLTHIETQRFIDNVTSITPGALKGGLATIDRFPERDQMVIGGADGIPKIYKIYRTKKRVIGDDFNLINSFEAMPGRIFDVRFSVDGKFFVAGSSDSQRGEIRLYASEPKGEADAANKDDKKDDKAEPVVLKDIKPVWRLETNDRIYAVAISTDGKTIAAGGFQGVIRLIDAETGKQTKRLSPAPRRF
jgi:WD40 repeat protein